MADCTLSQLKLKNARALSTVQQLTISNVCLHMRINADTVLTLMVIGRAGAFLNFNWLSVVRHSGGVSFRIKSWRGVEYFKNSYTMVIPGLSEIPNIHLKLFIDSGLGGS